MGLFQQRISNLLGGVSQRPLVEMFQNQLQSCDDFVARLTYGLIKRPPFTYVAKLTSTLTGVDSAFMFAINRSEDERYRVIVRDGTIAVLDAETGDAVTVEDRSAGSYLDAVSGKSYRAVTVGDETYIVNQGVTVAKGTEKSDAKLHEALVTVEQADFSTNYKITVEGVDAEYDTIDADTASSRRSIATDFIAARLRTDLQSKAPQFTITRLGSTLHISYSADFAIDVSDGLGDNGLFLVKGEVETIEDLNRTRAPHGTKVKVLGSRGTDADDYWVRYDSSEADASEDSSWGIWKETVAPSTVLNMDADTMPHKLVYQQSKLGEELETKSFPKAPTLSGGVEGAATGGWTEDENGNARTATNGGSVSAQDEGFQAPIPGADGSARTVTVRYHIHTVDVDPGIITLVSLEHDIDGGGTVVLDTNLHERGISGDFVFEVEEDFAAADKLRLIMTDNRQETFDSFNAPSMSVNGSGHDPAPITANTPKGITLTVTPGTYFEGLQVTATLDGTDYTYAVQAGDDADAIATGLAAVIDADAALDSTATDNVIAVEVTADSTADVGFESAEITFIADTAVLELPDGLTLSITEDEFVGDELVNLTDGSSGTITANDTAGLFTVDAFAGGADNTVSPGDILVVEGTGAYFVFQPVSWATRKVGDSVSNPWPSFVRREINDVFFFRNRLGFLTGAHVVMSQSGKRTNFFRSTVIDVLDGGRIDIESAHPEVSDFQHAVVWNRNLFLWSDSAQYELGGEPVLSPKTVRLDVLSRFSNSRKVPPLVLGRRILFAHQQQGHVRIYEWAPPTDAEPVFQAIDITKEVPTYMAGEVVQMAGDYGHGLMALICDGDQDAIYIYSYADNPDGSQVFGAWQRATLPAGATARQLVFVDGKLSVITSYADGIFLDEGDYDQPAAEDDDDVIFVDRQVDENGFTDFEQFGGTAEDVIFTSGFDYHGDHSADFARYSAVSAASSTVEIESGVGKYGGDALRQEFGSLSQSILRKKVLATARQGGRASFHIRETAFNYPQGYIFEVYDDSTRHFRLVAAEDDAGELTVLDFDGTLLATGTVDLSAAAYTHVDIQWKLSQSGDGFVKVWLDGVASISVTGINLGAASEEWDSYGHQAPFGGTKGFRIDDIVIRGQTSPLLDTGHRIWSVLPDSDVGVNEWTTSSGTDHYALVDDTDPDQDLTRLLASAAGDREEFGFTLPAITGSIANVQVKALVALDSGAGYPGVKLGLRVGDDTTLSDAVGNFTEELATSYETASFSIPLQPNGENWTAAALESAALLLESTDDQAFITQIWLEVLTVGGSVDGPTTEVELPYEPQEDPVGIDTCNDEELTATELASDRYSFPGTIAEECLKVGQAFVARARIAPFYLRGDNGQPETGGRCQVRRMDVEYNRTQDLKVEVTPIGRSKYTHAIDEDELTEGERRVPIMARGEDTVIELVSDDTGDARVSSIDAEFYYYNRSRRT